MEATEFDEEALFSAIACSGVRALLIGRRVLVAQQASTKDGVPLRFDDAWARRTSLRYTPTVPLLVPCIDDMILTKRWSLRPKDVDDIAMLEKLKQGGGTKS